MKHKKLEQIQDAAARMVNEAVAPWEEEEAGREIDWLATEAYRLVTEYRGLDLWLDHVLAINQLWEAERRLFEQSFYNTDDFQQAVKKLDGARRYLHHRGLRDAVGYQHTARTQERIF